ncbi:MAG: hypothetical protein DWQ44_02095 [Bacteroidetes bacterium]|nr:MAG: hypothetical protein DWQ33_05825 [Bacteroidota bacterium]REK04766.1 MAG: hypothetical protein DWQ39_05990 [Bacteroidota bacterium]REK36240.1 MAG: hypothetical protein DWQ44_02095 [Bacteroidota bacterium]REK51098.1 MAG: hypothetical protein DWQ48_03130 [Bacteroidota bacterium]
MQSRNSESELLVQISQGENQAIMKLYDEYSPLIYGIIINLVRDREKAEEIFLETFNSIISKSKSYKSEHNTLAIWLINMTRQAVYSITNQSQYSEYLKNSKSNPEQPFSVIKQAGDTYKSKHEAVLNELESGQRQMLEMILFGNYSQSEIAVALGVPLGTVKTRSRAALLKFRDGGKS